jgi:hypothetical protein
MTDDLPAADDADDEGGPADGERLPLDRQQLAFLTRHMGRVIGEAEWTAAVAPPTPAALPDER